MRKWLAKQLRYEAEAGTGKVEEKIMTFSTAYGTIESNDWLG